MRARGGRNCIPTASFRKNFPTKLGLSPWKHLFKNIKNFFMLSRNFIFCTIKNFDPMINRKTIFHHSVCKMRFYARFACGNPHFHTSWYKISYDTRAKNVFLMSVITSLAFGSCCKLTLVRKHFITLVS